MRLFALRTAPVASRTSPLLSWDVVSSCFSLRFGNRLLRALTLFFLVWFCGVGFCQSRFSDIYVFGDSLSDVGNIDAMTFGLRPGSDYFDGRFSNGRVYAELLADKLGLGQLEHSSAGGNNFAFGGGRTSGTSFFEGGLFIRDLDDQIDDFLDSRAIDPDALHVVLAGANDFVLGEEANPSTPATRVQNEIGRLIGAGVKNLLSINLPLLGRTPRFVQDAAVMNTRSREFNTLLDGALDAATARHPSVTIFRVDLAELFEQVIALPSAYGFSNVTTEGLKATDPTGHLFWDDVHPTTQAHELLSEAALALLHQPEIVGDFNFDAEITSADVDILGYSVSAGSTNARFDLTADAVVDAADLPSLLASAGRLNGDADFDGTVDFSDFLVQARKFGERGGVLWSDGDFDLSGRVEFADFLILARNFGDSIGQAPQVVSEPAASTWLLALAAFTCSQGIRSRVEPFVKI